MEGPPLTIPAKRTLYKSTIASSVKMDALKADPQDGHCLITNEYEPKVAIQGCHALARSAEKVLVHSRHPFV